MVVPVNEWCAEVNDVLFRARMSRKDLCKRLGIHPTKMSLIINGKLVDKKAIEAISEAVNIKSPYYSNSEDSFSVPMVSEKSE